MAQRPSLADTRLIRRHAEDHARVEADGALSLAADEERVYLDLRDLRVRGGEARQRSDGARGCGDGECGAATRAGW